MSDPNDATKRTLVEEGTELKGSLTSTCPVLVVCGENDVLTGPPGPLAAAFADGRAVTVARRDHMTTVGDKVYKEAVLNFFSG